MFETLSARLSLTSSFIWVTKGVLNWIWTMATSLVIRLRHKLSISSFKMSEVALSVANLIMFLKLKLFCSTWLPLAITRRIWSTFSSHCPLSYSQRHWLTSATSIILYQKFFWECWESNLGLLGENHVCYLCAMQPPKFKPCLVSPFKSKLWSPFLALYKRLDKSCFQRLIVTVLDNCLRWHEPYIWWLWLWFSFCSFFYIYCACECTAKVLLQSSKCWVVNNPLNANYFSQ